MKMRDALTIILDRESDKGYLVSFEKRKGGYLHRIIFPISGQVKKQYVLKGTLGI